MYRWSRDLPSVNPHQTMSKKRRAIRHKGERNYKSTKPDLTRFCVVCGEAPAVVMGHCRECLDPMS